MKTKERHELKENDFAKTAATVVGAVQEHRRPVTLVASVAIVLAIAVGIWMFMRTHKANEAGALLGVANAIAQAPITPAPTLPGSTQTPGTYPTDRARSDAAIAAFAKVDETFPGTDAAVAANYHLGTELLAAGRAAEAQAAFHKVSTSGAAFYSALSRVGEAEPLMAQKKQDEAIKIYTDLAAQRDGPLPTDGLLMQLARAAQKAGKAQDARAAFKRVVDEFPDSSYAADARQQLAATN